MKINKILLIKRFFLINFLINEMLAAEQSVDKYKIITDKYLNIYQENKKKHAFIRAFCFLSYLYFFPCLRKNTNKKENKYDFNNEKKFFIINVVPYFFLIYTIYFSPKRIAEPAAKKAIEEDDFFSIYSYCKYKKEEIENSPFFRRGQLLNFFDIRKRNEYEFYKLIFGRKDLYDFCKEKKRADSKYNEKKDEENGPLETICGVKIYKG